MRFSPPSQASLQRWKLSAFLQAQTGKALTRILCRIYLLFA